MKMKTVKRLSAVLLTGALALSLISCGGNATSGDNANGSANDTSNENASETAQENGTEESVVEKKELLVVSFGTSYNDSRSITIGGIENVLRENFQDYEVVRAFTAQTIIDKLKDRDGIEIMNVKEALDDAVANGVTTLIVQPTHLMDGFEYQDLQKELADYEDKFEHLALAAPLLTSDEDYALVADALYEKTKQYDDGETAICFMGHGTEADSNKDYAVLQDTIRDKGYDNIFIATVEAEPTFEDIIEEVSAAGTYQKAVLLPLMVVAGDHANNDMASDEDDSWKSLFEEAGFEVSCVLEGLGQDYEIAEIYVKHTQDAIDGLE